MPKQKQKKTKKIKLPSTRTGKIRLGMFVAVFALIGVYLIFASFAATISTSAEGVQYNDINATRAQNGRGGLAYNTCLSGYARQWAQQMAAQNRVADNPNYQSVLNNCFGSGWRSGGENHGGAVANTTGSSPCNDTDQNCSNYVFNCFMQECGYNGTGHRDNILSTNYSTVGIGAYRDDRNVLWIVQSFAGCASTCPSNGTPPSAGGSGVSYTPPPPPPPLTWYLKSTNGTDGTNFSFQYGQPGDVPLACDWNGTGDSSAAIYRNGAFYITNHNQTGGAEYTVTFGSSGDIPVCGDWNGDGYQTPGVYRNGTFLLTNSTCHNCNAPTDVVMAFGQAGDKPVVGKWIGNNRTDWPGVWRSRTYTFYQRYSWSNGGVDNFIQFGNSTDEPLAGDWDGDGVATVGVKRGNTYYLSNDNHSTPSPYSFGNNDDVPIVGRWGTGAFSIGVVRGGASAAAVEATTLGGYYIVGGNSNRCVDLRNTTSGTQSQLSDCNNTRLERLDIRSDGTIHSAVLPNKCLDLNSSSTANGNSIQIWDCNGTAAQKWVLGNDRTIRSALNTNECMDTYGGGTAAGTKLIIWECHGSPNAVWTIK